ncbi:MAG: 4Fe-4S binding protein [Desulfobacterales bacterium]|nr:4Fe-4S binding protein [Desulfobacterales bacterium]
MAYTYHVDQLRCKGCGLCVTVCPQKVLEISDEMNELGYFPIRQIRPDSCRRCTTCCIMCPDVAISITEAETVENASKDD